MTEKSEVKYIIGVDPAIDEVLLALVSKEKHLTIIGHSNERKTEFDKEILKKLRDKVLWRKN